MKKFLILLILSLFVRSYAEELRVLAVGNSFSLSVTKHLPQITASVPGCRLLLTSTYIGGCSLERHWNNINKIEAENPKTYRIDIFDSDDLENKKSFRGKLSDLLKNNKYDIITIQQNSANSMDYSTYQPYAKNLISYIRKYQPQAEIIIQQTWSYRSDSGNLKQWNIDNSVMYERLADAYGRLAKENGFRIIPAGYAVQIFRAETPVKFTPVSGKELKKLKYPELPSYAGDVVGKHYYWRKNKNEKFTIACDSSHLNDHGEYMQAAVWFCSLFGKPAAEIKYIPGYISDKEAEFLLHCVQKAVSSFKQPRAE